MSGYHVYRVSKRKTLHTATAVAEALNELNRELYDIFDPTCVIGYEVEKDIDGDHLVSIIYYGEDRSYPMNDGY